MSSWMRRQERKGQASLRHIAIGSKPSASSCVSSEIHTTYIDYFFP